MKNKDTGVAYRRTAIITPVFVQGSGSLIFVMHFIKFSHVLNMGILIENNFFVLKMLRHYCNFLFMTFLSLHAGI
jgi:hypothetical protein